MSTRVSLAILLCEDELQERLVSAFLKRCGIRSPDRCLRPFVASKLKHGGNIGWVLEAFPDQLRAVRNRQKAKAETLLIVVIDADDGLVDDRRNELNQLAQREKEDAIAPDEIALLIPKRHIETWIRALLGEIVTEDQDCKRHQKHTKEEIRQAADMLFEWSRPNAQLGSNCVPSLVASLPVWWMIGARF